MPNATLLTPTKWPYWPTRRRAVSKKRSSNRFLARQGTVKANEYRSFSALIPPSVSAISEQKQWGSIPRRRASWQNRI